MPIALQPYNAVQVGPSRWHARYSTATGRLLLVSNAARLPIVYASYEAAMDQARRHWCLQGEYLARFYRHRTPRQLELPLTGGRLANA